MGHDHLRLATDSGYVLTTNRASLLHRLQPGVFYTVAGDHHATTDTSKNDDDDGARHDWWTMECLSVQPPRHLRTIGLLHRRCTETGVEQHVRHAVRELLLAAVLADRERLLAVAEEEAKVGGSTMVEGWAWIGVVLAAGFAVAALVWLAEITCKKLHTKCNIKIFKNRSALVEAERN